MTWQPQEEPLRQLGTYLNDTLGADKQARDHATEMLLQAKKSPDIINYLCYLFLHLSPANAPTIPPNNILSVRSAASLMLKNLLESSWPNMNSDGHNFIKESSLQGLSDPLDQIRKLSGNIITEIVRVGKILAWPDVLTRLITFVEGTGANGAQVSPETREAAMNALGKVCEDNRKSLDKDYNGQKPLKYLVPKLIELTASPIANVRGYALASINLFIPAKSDAIIENIDSLMEVLFRLANDDFDQVRRSVCRAIVQIVDIRPDKIQPHLQGIVDYMIKMQGRNPDSPEAQDVALEAAEFWLTVGENEEVNKYLGPHLNKIIPTLLSSMVYSEEDIIRLSGEDDDADEDDKEEDLKPVFAKNKSARLQNGEMGEEPATAPGAEEGELSEGELDEFDEDFFLSGMEDPEDKWNLRKCSAAALDVLASVYRDGVFEIILPYLKNNLFHQEWQYREAAVLALGAVADGCMDGVTPHLPELIPYLIGLLNDNEALVRQITCWTLGRYSRWAAQSDDPVMKSKYFEPMMEGILTKMLDNNKRVQEAAASAFANLEEQTKDRLIPYMEPIVRQFINAMGRYKDRNMYILYDCIQTLAEHVGVALARKDIVDLLMPALIGRWKKVKDENRELFPLLECFSFVAQALGQEFSPYAEPIFNRCIHIIHANLEQAVKAATEPEIYEFPDKDFLVTSLDLMSAIIQALDNRSAALVDAHPSFFQLLGICLNDPSNDVKQSAYALLGDCAIYVIHQLHPYIPQIMGLLVEQLAMDKITEMSWDTRHSVVNNACWSCGEIALQEGASMAPYVDKLFPRLLQIIQRPDIPVSVTENAAIALGRLGLGSCDELAPHLETFAFPFLDALAKVAETDEKDTAFRGFVMVVGRNPEAMESCLAAFFKAIARYKNASKELEDLFKGVIVGYKGVIQDWPSFMSTLPQTDQEKLHQKYGL